MLTASGSMVSYHKPAMVLPRIVHHWRRLGSWLLKVKNVKRVRASGPNALAADNCSTTGIISVTLGTDPNIVLCVWITWMPGSGICSIYSRLPLDSPGGLLLARRGQQESFVGARRAHS